MNLDVTRIDRLVSFLYSFSLLILGVSLYQQSFWFYWC